MWHTRLTLVALFCALLGSAQAQNEVSLTRDDVGLFKKKLVAVFDALGSAPSGYGMERESYNLPTDAYSRDGGSHYQPTNASASRDYGSSKSAEDASKELEKEYKKKILEAQGKGDYEAMGKIAMEMQQKIGELSLKAEEGKKEPISVHIAFNEGGGGVIDPDAVVHEQPGVIALKSLDAPSDRGEVRIYFDPVTLKNTKQLSKVSLDYPDAGVSKKTTVLNATISLSGPTKEIEAWTKRVDFKKVLSQIDR